MNLPLHELVVVVSPDTRLRKVISLIGKGGKQFPGIALVLDSETCLKGVIQNGDIIRLLAASESLDCSIGEVMNDKPVTVPVSASEEQLLNLVREKSLERTAGRKEFTRYVPVLGDGGTVVDLIDIFSLLARSASLGSRVEIYGLGFVGLTLAVALANRGHRVTGIDLNESLVARLRQGLAHVFEPQLSDMMRQTLDRGYLLFNSEPPEQHNRVKIITVGTPINSQYEFSMDALISVSRTVGRRLRKGDIVMLRSTVPVGTTRGHLLSIYENESGLKAGEDFALAFTPERTVEGNAMKELTSLPQIVGGFSSACAEKATSFWQTLADSTVLADGLEAAELVKLINNGFRDLSFSFANGLASLASQYNLDAARIVTAANEGYPRNRVPLPSPGVGGYCLTKDPYLYSAAKSSEAYSRLSVLGREINTDAGFYPVRVLERYQKRHGYASEDLSILVAGMAFKGIPETNDLRNSSGVSIALELKKHGFEVAVFDAVCQPAEFEALGLHFVDMIVGARDANVIMIMNNHPGNVPDGLLQKLEGRAVLLFDGWSLLDKSSAEQFPELTYANMGYMTPEDRHLS